jgi:tRNA(fMet)-specific endonuclease VapC
VGLILDSSLLIADERERFDLTTWLRSRPLEPVAISAITLSELWFGVEVEPDPARAKRRRRWLDKLLRRLEVVPMDAALARVHSRVWVHLSEAGQMIGPHDLIVAATACIAVGQSPPSTQENFRESADYRSLSRKSDGSLRFKAAELSTC